MAATEQPQDAQARQPFLPPKITLPESLSFYFFPFNASDTMLTWLAAVVATTAALIEGRLEAGGVAVVYIVLMWSHSYERTYDYFVGVSYSLWLRYFRKGVLADLDKQPGWLSAILSMPPAVPLSIWEIGSIGVLHNEKKENDSVVLVGSGSGMRSMSPGTLYHLLQRFADGVQRLSAFEKGSVGVSFVFRRRPFDLVRLEAIHDLVTHPGVMDAPDEPPADGKETAKQARLRVLKRNQRESETLAAIMSGDVDMAVVLSVPQPSSLRKIRKNVKRRKEFDGLTEAELRQLTLTKMARMAQDILTACEIEDVHTLNGRELHKYIHGAWEVNRERSYEYSQDASQSTDSEVLKSTVHSPKRLVVKRSHIEVDGNLHSAIRITRCPKYEDDTYFSQLHAVDVQWLTVTLLGKVTKTKAERRWRDIQIPLFDRAKRELFGGVEYETPEARKRRSDLVERRMDIAHGKVGKSFNILVGVSASNTEELDNGVDEVLRHCHSVMLLETEQVTWEHRQLPTIISLSTGVNML